ncbi:hypothetical protein V1279_003087 [Bradyrhizobium sp. AZCC 1610]|uniref:hypothetical protein n=1 Tax=Bradyrhizobium sp. AZCC 1610 TaxID=3117020 RepID=UPI002FEF2285
MVGLRWKTDSRPQRHGWAPGWYLNNCRGEGCKDLEDPSFIGAKRAYHCADCAYALPDPVPVDRVANAVDAIVDGNPDKWEQALLRPQLVGWFVGRVMKALNGAADPDEVYQKVMTKFGARP